MTIAGMFVCMQAMDKIINKKKEYEEGKIVVCKHRYKIIDKDHCESFCDLCGHKIIEGTKVYRKGKYSYESK